MHLQWEFTDYATLATWLKFNGFCMWDITFHYKHDVSCMLITDDVINSTVTQRI